ncbi:MAG: acetyltransferase, partial [Rhodoglobus sp.]|nr:acetyltransferase [Rhodoglobus sp.]
GVGEAQKAVEEGQRAIDEAASARARGSGPGRPVPLPRGDQIYAVGDSVMLAASPWLQEHYPGIAIDAAVSRSMWVAPSIVQSIVDAGALRPILIIGLGTNGNVDPVDLAAVLTIVGDDTLVVVINAQAPKDWIPGANAALAEFARRERTVELANWHDAIAPRIDELARDQVHPGGPISSGIYIASIDNALQRLAELPPLLDADDYQYLNRPV